MSQAPGLSGTPDSGHCWRAATRAPWARSSARPTSRTIRASPAMSLGDSIRQTASIARRASAAVTAPVETPSGARQLSAQPLLGGPLLGRHRLEVRCLGDLAHL